MNIQEITEIVHSSNLNFLIGAGASYPFLPLLGNIEDRLSTEKLRKQRLEIKKEYFEKVMAPNIDIVEGSIDSSSISNYEETHKNYKDFFEYVSFILFKRKNTILSKQANIFTTNIDILMETVLEENSTEYNDGFCGRLNPIFDLSHFKRSIFKRSLHFENVSEVPSFNLIKLHGSLTWLKSKDRIFFTKLEHFKKDLSKKSKGFEEGYKKIAIVNPEKKKFEETVIDLTHFELLRIYASELEKQNSVLFVIGFSMDDEHIREITIGIANSNPTLKIYIFCHSKNNTEMQNKMRIAELKYGNIEIIEPQDDQAHNKFNLKKVNESVLKEMLNKIDYDPE